MSQESRGAARHRLRRVKRSRARRRASPPRRGASPRPAASTADRSRVGTRAGPPPQAPCGLRDLTDLAAEPDLAHHEVSASSPATDLSPRPRARPRDRARLADANPAGDAGVHVGRATLHTGAFASTASSSARRVASRPARRVAAPGCRRTRRVPAPPRAADARPRGPARPRTGRPDRRSARNSAEASGTSARPSPRISNTPSSLWSRIGAYRPEEPKAVMAVALEREDGVDDVLEHSRPGQGAVLGDVAHEDRGQLARFASATSADAHSRTCVTDPGAPATRGRRWPGSSRPRGHRAPARRPARGRRRARSRPRRAARPGGARRRARLGGGPAPGTPPRATSRHRAPRPASWPSACSSSVLLPIPGSPPSSVTTAGDEPAAEDPVELADAGGPASARRPRAPRRLASARAPDPRPGRRGAQHPGRGGPPSQRARPRRHTRGNARASGVSVPRTRRNVGPSGPSRRDDRTAV